MSLSASDVGGPQCGRPPMMDLLEGLPVGASLHSVTAVPGVVAGRAGLRVELTDEITADGIPGVDYVDMLLRPGFLRGSR
jgi:hypothetical protein